MHFTKNQKRFAAAFAVLALVAGGASVASATVAPGTPARDVHFGLDNDNASNTFIQPPGVTAKQHMDNTDVLFGRQKGDLLVGNLGGDTLIGGPGKDILIGGPENFSQPSSDVLLGDRGNDINIWAPGDGSDAYVGDKGYDTMIFAPFLKNTDGSLRLERFNGRKIPGVDISAKPQFTCEIVKVPKSQHMGEQFLVRFFARGNLAATVRQKDVERVLCPSPDAGYVHVAHLTDRHPAFHNVPLRSFRGVLGGIIAAPASR